LLLSWKEAWVLPGFNHFWSLAVEEHFYLVWPLVIYLCTRRQAMAVCVAAIIVAAVLRMWLLWLGGWTVALETLTLCRMDALAVGGLLALAARGPAGVRPLVPWTGACAVAGFVAIAALAWFTGSGWRIGYTATAFLFGALILVGVATDPTSATGRLWNNGFLRFCGKYSYGWYVFQGTLSLVLGHWFTANDVASWVGSVFLGHLLFVAWGAVLSLALAVLSWHLYEKHFLKLKDVFASKEAGQREKVPAAGFKSEPVATERVVPGTI
jgi:peptidoglycan/LPS O-acetylase OafA/YrhL